MYVCVYVYIIYVCMIVCVCVCVCTMKQNARRGPECKITRLLHPFSDWQVKNEQVQAQEEEVVVGKEEGLKPIARRICHN